MSFISHFPCRSKAYIRDVIVISKSDNHLRSIEPYQYQTIFYNFFVTICTCMYYSTKYSQLMSHILVKLPQNKFDNDKYGIGEDFQRLEK